MTYTTTPGSTPRVVPAPFASTTTQAHANMHVPLPAPNRGMPSDRPGQMQVVMPATSTRATTPAQSPVAAPKTMRRSILPEGALGFALAVSCLSFALTIAATFTAAQG